MPYFSHLQHARLTKSGLVTTGILSTGCGSTCPDRLREVNQDDILPRTYILFGTNSKIECSAQCYSQKACIGTWVPYQFSHAFLMFCPGENSFPWSLQWHWLTATQPFPVMSSYTMPAKQPMVLIVLKNFGQPRVVLKHDWFPILLLHYTRGWCSVSGLWCPVSALSFWCQVPPAPAFCSKSHIAIDANSSLSPCANSSWMRIWFSSGCLYRTGGPTHPTAGYNCKDNYNRASLIRLCEIHYRVDVFRTEQYM